MAGNRIVEVRLPDGVEPTQDDVDQLLGIFEAIVALRFNRGPIGEAEQILAGEGWAVRTHLAWKAEARKGTESEQVSGATREEALAHLLKLVRADQVISAP